MRARAAGFTLIELLVVLVLIALASAAVVVSLPPADPLAGQVQQLAARLSHARDLAVLNNRSLQLVIDHNGYHFSQRQQRQWLPSSEPALARQHWQQPTSIQFDGRDSDQVSVLLDPAGGQQPGLLALSAQGHHWQLQLQADGGIYVQRR